MSEKKRAIITLQTGNGDISIGAGNIVNKESRNVTDIYLSFGMLDDVQTIGDTVLDKSETPIVQVRFNSVESFNVLLRAVEQMKEYISDITPEDNVGYPTEENIE